MRAAISAVLALAVAFALTFSVNAQEKKAEVELKGTVTCAKCDLKLDGATKCATVLVVKDEKTKKDVVYYFDAEGDKANHKEICKAGKAGTVKGTVTEKDGKKTITVSKVDLK